MNSLDRITACCIAFAGDTRLASLNMVSTSPGASMYGFGTERNQFGGAIDVDFRQGAVGLSIDDFVTMFSPPLPTHVKIDVDGIWADILRGGRRTLSAQSVRSVIVEVERGKDLGKLDVTVRMITSTDRPKRWTECVRPLPEA